MRKIVPLQWNLYGFPTNDFFYLDSVFIIIGVINTISSLPIITLMAVTILTTIITLMAVTILTTIITLMAVTILTIIIALIMTGGQLGLYDKSSELMPLFDSKLVSKMTVVMPP
jgi:hypothetical protein